jgi:HPt (histidine-containing phosphotransfer) domain-containing protein
MVNAVTNAHLIAMMQGNDSLVHDLIDHFIDYTPALVDRLEEAMHSRDWNAVFGVSQRLISGFRLMNIQNVIEHLRSLDEESVRAMPSKEQNEICAHLRRSISAFE